VPGHQAARLRPEFGQAVEKLPGSAPGETFEADRDAPSAGHILSSPLYGQWQKNGFPGSVGESTFAIM
jgi:hypothetical protein